MSTVNRQIHKKKYALDLRGTRELLSTMSNRKKSKQAGRVSYLAVMAAGVW